ncbi:MAG: glycosyltransferase [Acidobacteria bacterium]|nr:glycosyltransferase [Acidobacteriota bacterium]
MRRVAFFTDSFHEVNGVALTSREFARFARTRGAPFFSVHPGPTTKHWIEGPFETFEIDTGPYRLDLERDLHFDLAFLRHRAEVRKRLEAFAPDLVHVTGPGHVGLLGALLAYDLGVPLAASWHTNVHEYGARRLAGLLGALPEAFRESTLNWAEQTSLSLVMWFYRKARVLFAPNQELVDRLAEGTGLPVRLMRRGIDCDLYRPDRRARQDAAFVVGFVGRLSPEKNVRELAAVEQALEAAGAADFRMFIVGDGAERDWLRQNLKHCDAPGILTGEPLAAAYASMDVFAFPSLTDTYGNVVSEAQASGVPAVVMNGGGPKFLVRNGVDGFVANSPREFAARIVELHGSPDLLGRLRLGAREAALGRSWEAVFEGVYHAYDDALEAVGQRA